MIPQFEPYILPEYAELVAEQINSGWIGSGATTTKFENDFAKTIGRNYAIACTSGTAAIMISLWAAKIKPGDKVFIPDYSFPAAFQTCRLQGFDPILIDINAATMCMSYKAFKDAILIHPDVKAVVWIPHNGYIDHEFAMIQGECNARGILFLEDSACGLGCKNNYGIKCGTIGQISTFSFSVPKLLTTGQGGMIVTDDESIMVRCREIIDQGSTTWRKTGIHEHSGANFKFNDILAAYGLAQLSKLDMLLMLRKSIMNMYLMNEVKLCSIQNLSSPWMMAIQTPMAHRIQIELEGAGFQSKMLYKPTHYSLNPENKKFPGAEKAYLETLYLPSSLGLNVKQIKSISEIVNKF